MWVISACSEEVITWTPEQRLALDKQILSRSKSNWDEQLISLHRLPLEFRARSSTLCACTCAEHTESEGIAKQSWQWAWIFQILVTVCWDGIRCCSIACISSSWGCTATSSHRMANLEFCKVALFVWVLLSEDVKCSSAFECRIRDTEHIPDDKL